MAAAKKTASKKKTAAKKTAAKKSATKKAAARKSPATKAPAKKKAAAKKTASKKAPAKKKSAAKQAPSKKTATKKAPAKKSPAKKAAAKKTVAKKSASKKTASTKPAERSGAARPSSKRASTKMSAKKSTSSQSPLLSNDVPSVHEIPAARMSKDGIGYTKDFDVKFLKSQRDELEARKAAELKRATRLEDEAESLIEDGEMGDVQFDDEGGEGDTMVVQRDLDRLLSSQARQTILEIDEALERIKTGIYGYSEVSGLPIPRERLEALPETTVLAAEKVSGAGRR
ncbi:TraR/DksA family transcriptional regulator [Ilumatobacter nonamiensis]|uniref:TraR/DksA family transcriptional regulator n=1 Tax=Ilumatobacter nonamiensis TaxID=467093 RepID=UPI00187DC37D|nr:histone H1-like repetitive region-containing protein [Ilumatobacter nonamiensis]